MNEVSSEWGAVAEVVCYCLSGTAILLSILFYVLYLQQDHSVHQVIDDPELEEKELGQVIALYVLGAVCAFASASFLVAAWLIRLVA